MMYLVTITYRLPMEARDPDTAIEGMLRLTRDQYGDPTIFVAPMLPLTQQPMLTVDEEHALHCDTRIHRENVCTCLTHLKADSPEKLGAILYGRPMPDQEEG